MLGAKEKGGPQAQLGKQMGDMHKARIHARGMGEYAETRAFQARKHAWKLRKAIESDFHGRLQALMIGGRAS